MIGVALKAGAVSLLRVLFMGILLLNASLTMAAVEVNQQVYDPDANRQIAEFKRLLSDPNIQQWLLQSSVTEASENDAEGLKDNFSLLLTQIRVRKEYLFAAWEQIAEAPELIVENWQLQMSATESLRAVTYMLIFLFVGAGLEWLYAQYTRHRLLGLELQKPGTLQQKIRSAVLRALITLGGLLFFACGSIGVFLSFSWEPLVEYLVLEMLIVILMVRVGITISRFFLAPRLKELRLVPFSDAQAEVVHRWASILIFLATLNTANTNIFDRLLANIPGEGLIHSALSLSLMHHLLLLAAAQIAIYQTYQVFIPVSHSAKKRVAGKFWAAYLSIFLIVIYLLWVLDITLLRQSLIIVGLLIPLTHLFRVWVDYLFDQAEHEFQTSAAFIVPAEATENAELVDPKESLDNKPRPYDNYRPIARRLTRFVLVVLAIMSLMIVWGFNIFNLSSSPTIADKLFEVGIDVIAALLIADLIWVWAKTYIDKRLADYQPPEDGHAPGPEARMATLLPLLRTILIVTLVSMVSFSVLASLGFNIGPLLAGAGVIGLAIGFGAQTLVKDVVSGIFYLIDDAFRVGEYIEVGDLRGTVESMSVRSLIVRHHRGAVHTIPFGELKAITNHSRDWVIMKLEFRIPFDTNMKQVKKLIKKIGAELLENADFGHSFIEPLKSQGVRRMEEFNMVLGVKFMTRPGEQWVIRREAYHRIRDSFEANGIHMAERNVKVEVLSDMPLNEKIKQAVMGAAQAAIEQPVAKGPVPDEP